MSWVLPDSIAGRSLLVLLIGLTISHLLSTAVYSTDRYTAVLEANERQFADRMASAARLMEKADPDRRKELVEVLNSPVLTVSWTQELAFPHEHEESPELSTVRQALTAHFGPLDKDRIHVIDRSSRELFSAEGPQHGFLDWIGLGRFAPEIKDQQSVQVSLRLGDGSWANFGLTVSRPASFLSHRSILSIVIMALGIILFSALATRWIGRPLATFAAAADRLGRDVNAPPLPPGGPREVRQAIDAFNEMQSRIRRFVDDRTRMLAAISHDLRSPITRLKLRAELLADDTARTKMMADLNEMEAMVSSTLDFAKGEGREESIETIDLAAMLEAICDNASDMGLAAEFHWTGRLLCAGRPLALKRAFANVIENGARYGGAARVRADGQGSDIRVLIDDDGKGIPEDCLEKVFTPFFRIDPSRNRRTGGIGLGLTVARTILRAHGGDIALRNRPEGGLRVEVKLPRGSSSV